jgi:DNA-binding NarL/FixJ family response regulator
MPRILIADDHEGTRGILRVLLENHAGWEICGEASTNSEALQKSLELKPDVLVKDWVMPGVSNLEITREIARRLPATAIILFSFHDLPELESIAKATGVHGVASKNLSSLIQAIEKALHSSAYRQSATDKARTEPAAHSPRTFSSYTGPRIWKSGQPCEFLSPTITNRCAKACV